MEWSEVKKDLLNLVKTTGSKYAIALSANANHGKTSILKKLTDEFRANKSAVLVNVSPMQSNNDEMWCFELDGVRIGVVTGGDDASAVDARFDFAIKNGCQILFCATRYYSNSPSWNEFLARCQNDGYIDDWQKVDEYSDATLDVMHSDIAQNVLWKML